MVSPGGEKSCTPKEKKKKNLGEKVLGQNIN